MLNNISLGRYVDTGSILHKTDPRLKIILYIVYLVAVFIVDSPPALVALFFITMLQLIVAKIPLDVMWSTLKPVLPLALFIFLINIFTIKQGEVVFTWKFITVTDYGSSRAILMSLRLVFLILSTSVLLTLTTTPLKVADALEYLMSPLKVFHVPVHEASMMMSIALRFIPTLIEETDKIMKAQESRGANYDTGSFVNRIKGYITVLIPLFVSVIQARRGSRRGHGCEVLQGRKEQNETQSFEDNRKGYRSLCGLSCRGGNTYRIAGVFRKVMCDTITSLLTHLKEISRWHIT